MTQQPGQEVAQRNIIEQTTAQQAALNIASRRQNEHLRTLTGGLMLGAAAVALVAAEYVGYKYGGGFSLAHRMPFIPEAQSAVEHVTDDLVPVGEVLLPATVAAVAGVKLAGRWSPVIHRADKASSREPNTTDRPEPRRFAGLRRRVGAAAVIGTALAGFTASLATAITEGPNDALDALNKPLPGDSLLVEYPGFMPMVQSHVNPALANQVRADATTRGIKTHTFSFNLGVVEYKGSSTTDLAIGIETPPGSPLYWNPNSGCTDVPILLDSSQGAKTGDHVTLNGTSAVVVGELTGAASSNRNGIVENEDALKTCTDQDPHEPSYGMSLETDPKTAKDILDQARNEIGLRNAPASIITKLREKANNAKFWDDNAKPLTSILTVAGGAMAAVAMFGSNRARLLRNRDQLAAQISVAGGSARFARATELLRSAKDGVVAFLRGTLVAIPASLVPNFIEPGFNAGMAFRETMVAGAAAIIGSVGGAAWSLIKLRSIANPEENAR
jgi:hypothetical protein